MRTRSLFVSSVMGVALLGLAGSASAAGVLTTYTNSISVAPQTEGVVSVSCPTPKGYVAPLAVGGGFDVDDVSVEIYQFQALTASKTYTISGKKSTKTVAVGWTVGAKNDDYTYAHSVIVTVQCLTGAPSPSTTYVQVGSTKPVFAYNAGTYTLNPSCSSGIAVAGGFTGDVDNYTVPGAVRVYDDQRHSSTSWQISLNNGTGVNKNFSATAYCLNGWSKASLSESVGQALTVEGITQPGCTSGLAVGGGYKVPPLLEADVFNNPTVINMTPLSSNSFAIDMEPGAVDEYPPPAPNSWGYAECLTAP
jgi:hypothetical protein